MVTYDTILFIWHCGENQTVEKENTSVVGRDW